MAAESFRLQVHVDMANAPAFLEDVIAYPAITAIGREKHGKARIARRPEITAEALRNLAREFLEDETSGGKDSVAWRPARVAARLGLALLGGAGRRGAADELFEGGAMAFEGRHDPLRNLPIFGRLRRADRVGAVHGPDTDPDTNGGRPR